MHQNSKKTKDDTLTVSRPEAPAMWDMFLVFGTTK